jgi:hypothetical protein
MNPATPDINRSAGSVLNTPNISQAPDSSKNIYLRRMADMTPEEFKAIAAEIRGRNRRHFFRYDPREFQGPSYWERGFLSCAVAGAKIPPQITPEVFKIPRNKIIFHALRELERLDMAGVNVLITFLRETSRLEAAGGGEYIRDIERMVGIPSAIQIFALGILRLNLGAKI